MVDIMVFFRNFCVFDDVVIDMIFVVRFYVFDDVENFFVVYVWFDVVK